MPAYGRIGYGDRLYVKIVIPVNGECLGLDSDVVLVWLVIRIAIV